MISHDDEDKVNMFLHRTDRYRNLCDLNNPERNLHKHTYSHHCRLSSSL